MSLHPEIFDGSAYALHAAETVALHRALTGQPSVVEQKIDATVRLVDSGMDLTEALEALHGRTLDELEEMANKTDTMPDDGGGAGA